jgi:hypothetical protein
MLRPGNVEKTWRDPCESVARDRRLVPAAGAVLAFGGPRRRALARSMALVLTVSRDRHYIRCAVRIVADNSVSARTPIGVPQ